LAETGEDTIVSCDSCEYAANMEKAEVHRPEKLRAEALPPPEKVATPQKSSIADVAAFLNICPERLVKTLILQTDVGVAAALLRGDHELNEAKVKNALAASELRMADEETIVRITGGPVGFSGPIGLKGIPVLADYAVEVLPSVVVGANEADFHFVNVAPGRDFTPDRYGDFRLAEAGAACPRCASGRLGLSRGIEVGHVFKLGVKYSESMGARFLDAQGMDKPMIMGCYGIGVSRAVAAAIEQNHDADGIIFPPAIAPFSAVITPVGARSAEIDAAAEEVYKDLWANGIDCLLDDRDERPGVKFKDADLIGVPWRITIGKKAMAEGRVELRNRRTGEMKLVPLAEVVAVVKNELQSWNAAGDDGPAES
jgi:prolyl-tRNA synthetase